MLDLLTADEERDRANVFDIGLLSGRLVAATRWAHREPQVAESPIRLSSNARIFKLRLDAAIAAQRHVRLSRQLVQRLPGRTLAHHDRRAQVGELFFSELHLAHDRERGTEPGRQQPPPSS